VGVEPWWSPPPRASRSGSWEATCVYWGLESGFSLVIGVGSVTEVETGMRDLVRVFHGGQAPVGLGANRKPVAANARRNALPFDALG